jgi:hypothetical protein
MIEAKLKKRNLYTVGHFLTAIFIYQLSADEWYPVIMGHLLFAYVKLKNMF